MDRRTFLTATASTALVPTIPAARGTEATPPEVPYPDLARVTTDSDWRVEGRWRSHKSVEKYGYTVLDANAASVLYEQHALRDRVAARTSPTVDRIVAPLLATRIDFDSYFNAFIGAGTVADHLTAEFESALASKDFTDIRETTVAGRTPDADVVREYTAAVPLPDDTTVTTPGQSPLQQVVADGQIPVRVVLGVWKPTPGTAYLGAFGYPDLPARGAGAAAVRDLRRQMADYIDALPQR